MAATLEDCSAGDDLIDLADIMKDDLSEDFSETRTQSDSSVVPDKAFACFCGKSFRRLDSLKKHKVIHYNDEGERCAFKGCNRVFLYESDRVRHEETHYKKPGFVEYCCDYLDCSSSFKTRRELLEHSTVHKKDLQYICPHDGCDRRFTYYGHFELHTQSHAADRPHYTCCYDGCGRVFLTRNGLIDHEQTHSSEATPYICNVSGCGKVFAFESHLLRHRRTHIPPTKRSKLSCPFEGCDRTFSRPDALKAHCKRHSDNSRPFSCDIEGCTWSFRTRYDLKRHVKVVHTT